jgi:hypothetical protein
MFVKDAEIERIARELLAEHGPRAARVAAERLNEMIDRNNIRGRDIWACVVHAIHEQQDASPPGRPCPGHDHLAPRLEAAG